MSYTIKEIEALTGIKAHTLRIWEQRYNFLLPTRTLTNLRRYSNQELKTILKVTLLYNSGIKISRINELMAGDESNNYNSAPRFQVYILELLNLMIDLRFKDFELKLNELVDEVGQDVFNEEILFHFLDKAEIIWSCQVNKTQEHIISGFLRQKLITSSFLAFPENNSSDNYVLCLPEYEHYDLRLLCLKSILIRYNYNVTYLGPNVPVKDLIYFFKEKKNSSLFLHLPKASNRKFLTSLLNNLHADIPVYILSPELSLPKEIPTKLHQFKTFMEAISYFK